MKALTISITVQHSIYLHSDCGAQTSTNAVSIKGAQGPNLELEYN